MTQQEWEDKTCLYNSDQLVVYHDPWTGKRMQTRPRKPFFDSIVHVTPCFLHIKNVAICYGYEIFVIDYQYQPERYFLSYQMTWWYRFYEWFSLRWFLLSFTIRGYFFRVYGARRSQTDTH